MGAPDWFAIRLDYARGQDLDVLARTYNITRAAIVRRAQREDWPRTRTATKVLAPAAHSAAEGEVAPTDAAEQITMLRRQRQEWVESRVIRREALRAALDETYRPADAPEDWGYAERLKFAHDAFKLAAVAARSQGVAQEGERRTYGLARPPDGRSNQPGAPEDG